jgi:hypothetical protein
MRIHGLLVVGLLASPALLTAQERITIGLAPRAGQVLSTRTTTEMVMDVAADASADPPLAAALPKMNLLMTSSFSGTTTVGVPDEQGRYEARVSIDDVSIKMTMNGQPAPFDLPPSPLNGQTITFTYNRDGRLVDMAAPGMDAMVETVKKMITNVAGLVSPVTLAIGETSTVPTDFSLPVPGGAGALGTTGEMQMTLVSITPEGADRIAHLTTTMTSQVTGVPGSTPGGALPGMTVQISGTGTLDMNLDRGIATSVQAQATYDTVMALPGKLGASMPPMHMHGTMKMSATTESR